MCVCARVATLKSGSVAHIKIMAMIWYTVNAAKTILKTKSSTDFLQRTNAVVPNASENTRTQMDPPRSTSDVFCASATEGIFCFESTLYDLSPAAFRMSPLGLNDMSATIVSPTRATTPTVTTCRVYFRMNPMTPPPPPLLLLPPSVLSTEDTLISTPLALLRGVMSPDDDDDDDEDIVACGAC